MTGESSVPMAVKLAVLKSGEDVIADIKEARDKETDKPLYYILNRPYVVDLVDTKKKVLMEGGNEAESSQRELYFTPWIPLSIDDDVLVPLDWVVTVVEPHEQVVETYTQKVGDSKNV